MSNADAQGTRTLENGREGDVAVQAVRIEAIEGLETPAAAELRAGMLIVGRDRDCDLTLDHPTVSRKHVSLELLAGFVRVTDLGSRNGVEYLGARVTSATVPVGGSLMVGSVKLRVAPLAAAQPLSDVCELAGLYGESAVMRALFARIEKVAPGEASVLISGETGTGKDSVARALHALSPRAARPFVVFDCGSASGDRMETELFGHVRGAFTGASDDRTGAVKLAEGGTLYFDAVNELPLELQPKLLRLLESREYRPVGGNSAFAANIRVVASSRTNIDEAVAAGGFRSDLLHRLSAIRLEVPPLRSRREDIPELARRFGFELTRVQVALRPSTIAALQNEPWPGNVRELQNAIQRWAALGSTDADTSRTGLPVAAQFKDARAEVVERFERDYLEALMTQHQGSITAAARSSGLSRMTLYRLLEKHKIK